MGDGESASEQKKIISKMLGYAPKQPPKQLTGKNLTQAYREALNHKAKCDKAHSLMVQKVGDVKEQLKQAESELEVAAKAAQEAERLLNAAHAAATNPPASSPPQVVVQKPPLEQVKLDLASSIDDDTLEL
eukprot:11655303-Alexandrium_andersonii.AAC.1